MAPLARRLGYGDGEAFSDLAKALDIAREKTIARWSNLVKDKELELREKIEAEQHREREKIRADRRKKRSEERSAKDAALKSGPTQQYCRSEISGDGGFSDLAKALDIAREKTIAKWSNLVKDKELELREKIEAEQHREREKIRADRRQKRNEERSRKARANGDVKQNLDQS